MDLSYKIKNEDRRSYPLNQWEMRDGTIVAIYQGFRGENPDLDFIVKYKEPNKRLRTPSHTHWIVDLVIKGELNQITTLSLVNSLITVYDNIEPFKTVEERNNYQLQYTSGLVETYPELDDIGALPIDLIATLVELFCKCEKQSTGAFMFRSMLNLCKEYLEGKKDYYQLIGTSKRV
tara:strand:+ start:3742 stop:4272 length:531 start_codon:yes stop_codon:yes gene_type:complete